MARDPRAFLWDVLDACQRILAFTQGMNATSYAENDLVRSAVERQLSIIGEALSQLAKLNPGMASNIPESRQIIALRNVLVHGYATLDHQRVWQEAEHGLPRLADAVRQILSESGPPTAPMP